MRKQGTLTRREGRRLVRRIKASLKADRNNRALHPGHAIMVNIGENNSRKAYGILRGWNKEVDPVATRPCYVTLEDQTKGRDELYTPKTPSGDPIPCNNHRPPRADHPPTDDELRQAAQKSSNGRTGRASKMRAEDLKEWKRGMKADEKTEREGVEGFKGAGDRWRLLVKLCQHI